MDPITLVEIRPVTASLLLLPTVVVVLAIALAPLRRRVPWLARIGSTRGTIFAALWLFAVDAVGTAATVQGAVHRTFESTELGLVRGPQVDPGLLADALRQLVALQGLVAICVLLLVPAAIVAAWLDSGRQSALARVSPVVATAAIALPVAAGAIVTICLLAEIVMCVHGQPGPEATWAAGNLVELGRWAILGVGAIGLMAATPIVVEAASRGSIVERRTLLWAQLLFVVGLGAWVLTRFCAEDVARGPMQQIAEGNVEALYGNASSGLDADYEGIDLPRGAWCHVDEIDQGVELPIPLVLTHSLEGRWGSQRFLGVASWSANARELLERADGRRPVLVAALDLHVTADEFGPYLRAAEELGIRELAIVTFTDNRERTLTFGDVYTRQPCVLVRTDLTHAHDYTLPGVWWGSLSHRLTEESIR